VAVASNFDAVYAAHPIGDLVLVATGLAGAILEPGKGDRPGDSRWPVSLLVFA
jgi:hypothetical protein